MVDNNQTNALRTEDKPTQHVADDPDRPDAERVAGDSHELFESPDKKSVRSYFSLSFAQWMVVVSVGLMLVSIILYLSKVVPPITRNPYVIVIGFLVALYPVLYVTARDSGFRYAMAMDKMVEISGDATHGFDARLRVGEASRTDDMEPKFAEVKDFLYGGFPRSFVQLSDVLPYGKDKRLDSKRHRIAQDDGHGKSWIHLLPTFTAEIRSDDIGTVYVNENSGIEYQWDSPEVDRATTRPDFLHATAADSMISFMQRQDRRLETLEKHQETMRNLLERQRQRADEEQLPQIQQALSITDRMLQATSSAQQELDSVRGDVGGSGRSGRSPGDRRVRDGQSRRDTSGSSAVDTVDELTDERTGGDSE